MDIAIVTGASSSLGLAISKRLIQLGFRVYGLGGDYANCPLNNVNFKPMGCDLADPDAVEASCRQILAKEKGVYVLVHNAKYFGRNAYPEMDNRELEQILRINLLCPLVLSRTLAGSLMNLQGYIIQLGSPYAETTRGGPAGAAASGGLKWMGEVLFQDLRGHGVRVCHISPEPNRGRDPRTVVRPGARLESSIDPDAVAQAVEQILQSPYGNIVTEMIMRPLRVSEPAHDPVVRLPYPEPKPVPYTVPREMIEAEEQLEDKDIEKRQERRQRQRTRKPSNQSGSKNDSKGSKETEKPDKAATRRDSKPPKDSKRTPKPAMQPEEKPSKPESQQPGPQAEQGSNKPRRRGRRKPKPPMAAVGFLDRVKEAPAESGKSAKDEPADPPVKKKSARKAAKKAAKKATRKAAKKARPAKKAATTKAAVKKRPSRKRAAKKAAPSSDSESG